MTPFLLGMLLGAGGLLALQVLIAWWWLRRDDVAAPAVVPMPRAQLAIPIEGPPSAKGKLELVVPPREDRR